MAHKVNQIHLAEYVRNVFVVRVPPEVKPDECLKPEFWTHIAAKLQPGAKVEVLATDRTWMREVYVLAVDKVSAKVVTLNHYDLTGKAKKAQDEAKNTDAKGDTKDDAGKNTGGDVKSPYYYAFFQNDGHCVVRRSDKEKVHVGLDTRDDAIEKADKLSKAEVAAS